MWQHSNKLIPCYGWLVGLSPLRFIFCNLWLMYVGTRTRNLVDYMGFTLHNSLSLAFIIFFCLFSLPPLPPRTYHVELVSRVAFKYCWHISFFCVVCFLVARRSFNSETRHVHMKAPSTKKPSTDVQSIVWLNWNCMRIHRDRFSFVVNSCFACTKTISIDKVCNRGATSVGGKGINKRYDNLNASQKAFRLRRLSVPFCSVLVAR